MHIGVLGPGRLFFGTSDITLDIKSGLVEINDPVMNNFVSDFNNGNEVEITIETKLTNKQMWLIMTGRKVSNNWLKLHGGIMQRKSYKERRK